MAANFLEQIVSEWYEYRGYFVRRNVLVGRRANGGYDGKLDAVAFHPTTKHLVHVEPSTDTDSWEKRELRFKRKFEVGERHVHVLFGGVTSGLGIEQIALLVFGGRSDRLTLGGGKLIFVEHLLRDIVADVSKKRVRNAAVPEQFPLLRTLQFAAEHKSLLFGDGLVPDTDNG